MVKQTKPRTTSTKSAKATKPRSRKVSVETIVDVSASEATPEARIEALREALSASHLDDKAITDLMLHCASVLAFRRATTAGGPETTPGLCYRGVGGSDSVSLWLNGFKVDTCSRQEAQDRGIPACG